MAVQPLCQRRGAAKSASLESLYGGKISYGWNNAAYRISGGVATNKPNAGIIEHHLYCLDAGQDYDMTIALSTDDDFANSGAAVSGSAAGNYGYEEYEMTCLW